VLRAIRRETEDGDEADETEAIAKTGPGKWLTAIAGSGGVGSLAGVGYGMDWRSAPGGQLESKVIPKSAWK
jgi:hypothetical protein